MDITEEELGIIVRLLANEKMRTSLENVGLPTTPYIQSLDRLMDKIGDMVSNPDLTCCSNCLAQFCFGCGIRGHLCAYGGNK